MLATPAPTIEPMAMTPSEAEPLIAEAARPPAKAAIEPNMVKRTSPKNPPRPRNAAQVTRPKTIPSGAENNNDMAHLL